MFCSFWNQSVQSLSHVRLFVTSWTAARQASLCATNSQCLLKLMSIESVMPSNHLILCRPLLLLPSIFPSIRSFPMSQFFTSGGQSIGASASVLPMNVQDWFPLGLTGLISLQFKGLSRIFSQHHILKTSILVESALAYLLFYRVRAGMGWRGSVPYYTIWVSIFNPPSHFLGFYMTICFFFALQQNLPHTSFGSPFPQPSFLC